MITSSFQHGWYNNAEKIPSPFFNARPTKEVSLLVIHNISLPLGVYGTPYIDQLFTGTLDCTAHASFCDLQNLEVSSHFLITRSGHIKQYVSTDKRAWHAGKSCYQTRENCNDFSIGIELEGCDTMPFTSPQYAALVTLSSELMTQYAINIENIVGHSDIAPERKTDPGEFFDWHLYKQQLLHKLNTV